MFHFVLPLATSSKTGIDDTTSSGEGEQREFLKANRAARSIRPHTHEGCKKKARKRKGAKRDVSRRRRRRRDAERVCRQQRSKKLRAKKKQQQTPATAGRRSGGAALSPVCDGGSRIQFSPDESRQRGEGLPTEEPASQGRRKCFHGRKRQEKQANKS